MIVIAEMKLPDYYMTNNNIENVSQNKLML